MKRYKIVGHPLNFCLSTPVMNALFEELGVEAEFETHDVPPEGLEAVMKTVRDGDLAGLITTMPHKTPAIEYLDVLSDEAKAINAVNLVIREASQLVGYNTDWLGALGAIQSVTSDLKGVHILVLGAGGAARAAAYGFQKEGAEVSMWNRSPEKAKEFAESRGIEWVEDMRNWEKRPTIIVNATSMSYQPKQSTMVPFPLWENVTCALDAVYGRTSLFLEEARAAKVKTIMAGEVWYHYQAVPMFEILTGKIVPLEMVERYTKESLT